MTITIYDSANNPVFKSRSLRGLSTNAGNYGGVVAIELRDNGTGGAFVSVKYMNGHAGRANIARMSFATKWAERKSKRKGTWWSGCEVVTAEKTASIDALANLDAFARHYLFAALWTDIAPDHAHMTLADIDVESIEKAARDCADFQNDAAELLFRIYPKYVPYPDAPTPQCAAGHDFHFTRNGHGVGFWDRGFGVDGDKLSDMVRHGTKYPPISWYVGDDGRVHCE